METGFAGEKMLVIRAKIGIMTNLDKTNGFQEIGI